MSKQLHHSPRRLQPSTEQHKQECVERVISENLVSAIRFQKAQSLTLGFTTRNRIDAIGVVERFLSIEQRLPSPRSFAGDLLERLEKENDSLVYHFPLDLVIDRDLALTCAFVEVERRADDLFTVCFGRGFSSPKLCAEVSHPQIAIHHLDFSLLHIPNSAGTKAFSTIAAIRTLHEQLQASGIEVDVNKRDQLRIKHEGHELLVTTSLLYCQNSSSRPIQTTDGLFVIPVKTVPSMMGFSDDKVSVSVSCALPQEIRSNTVDSGNKDVLGPISDLIQRLLLNSYGEKKLCGARDPKPSGSH